MPSIADITVKKNDGTTDIIFSGVQPSSGDGTAAVWKSLTVGSAASHQPEFRLVATNGMQGARRNLRITAFYPEIATNSTTGLTSVVNIAKVSMDFLLPRSMATTGINEAVSQFSNLLNSTLVRACLKAGYSAS